VTKARLKQYRNNKKEIEQLRARLEELETALYYPKIPHLTDMPKGGNTEGNHQEDLAIYHIELLTKYNTKLAELAAEQLAIENAIEGLSQTERMLMRYRYLDGLAWEEVCVRIGYSWVQTHAYHGKALQKLAELEGEKSE
jgi:DNA-directed RNA polymerase specialized sigma24 family protein